MLPFFLSPSTAALSAATTAVVAVVAAGILLLFFIWLLLGRRAAANRDTNEYPYEPRPLLTPNEERFYQALLPLAARYELHLLAKVRVADFVGVRSGLEKNDYGRYFSKIQAKHVDFMLADPEVLEPVLLIEVDDSSHETASRQDRDTFVDGVYREIGLPILHVWDPEELEEAIAQVLGPCYDEEPVEKKGFRLSSRKKSPDSH